MSKFIGYIRAIRNYLNTDKARHDIKDYVRALLIMIAVMAALRLLVECVR